MAFAESNTRAPRVSTFALLCSFAILTEYKSETVTALTPLNLFAAILIPKPVPQIKIPASTFCNETASATFAA